MAQGSNLGPTDGSAITMTYNRISPDNYIIGAADRFRLLRTSTAYTQSQVVSLLADPGMITQTPTGSDPEYTANFTMPTSTDEYLYLIWDYSN